MENTHIHQLYGELEFQFKVLESVDESRVKARKMSFSINTLVILIQFIGLASFIVFPIIMSNWIKNDSLNLFLTVLFALVLIIGPLFLYDKAGDLKLKQYKTIQDYHKNLFHSILTLDDIDSILKRTQEAQQLLKLTKKITKDREAEIGELTKKEIQFIITVLQYLKSDMFQAIMREKDKLKNAQDTLEKNVGGTSEYNAISSIQQARLDKQIQQFEELQRVLVKV